MATVTKQLDDFLDKLDSIDSRKFADKSDGEIEQLLFDFIAKLRGNLERDKTDASGALKASIAPLPVEYGNGVVKIAIGLDKHWKDVDQGQKPKGYSKEEVRKLQPKIFNWIQEKSLTSNRLAKIADEKTLKRSLSFAIATNILKKGTIKRFGYKGTRFVSRELPQFKENIIKAMGRIFKSK